MPKPYSQDLRDRVIDAVERGEMSRRAAARRYEISESVAIKWLERVERDGSREPAGHGGHRASKLMRHRDFLKGRASREIGRHASGPLRSPFGRARGQSRHLDDEPLLSPDRRHAAPRAKSWSNSDAPTPSPEAMSQPRAQTLSRQQIGLRRLRAQGALLPQRGHASAQAFSRFGSIACQAAIETALREVR